MLHSCRQGTIGAANQGPGTEGPVVLGSHEFRGSVGRVIGVRGVFGVCLPPGDTHQRLSKKVTYLSTSVGMSIPSLAKVVRIQAERVGNTTVGVVGIGVVGEYTRGTDIRTVKFVPYFLLVCHTLENSRLI